ncbi:MAG: cyclopropane-fatty-acyl-phospholipid synthase family protein [Myxococcota bacterium]
MSLATALIDWAERGRFPDVLVRAGVRQVIGERRREIARLSDTDRRAETDAFLASMRTAPIAFDTDLANRQHYEVPARFFELVLGPRLKYSSCWFEGPSDTLARAEDRMLALTCERAGLEDGMQVLDLGCGWGSLSLWIAEHFPNCRVHAVSNSAVQAAFIRDRAHERGHGQLAVETSDMNVFEAPARFERVLSVEMFEHMRNWEQLLGRIAGWLAPNGQVFLHHFCHRQIAYPYEDAGDSDWMARNFFTGGMMPSEHLLADVDSALHVEEQWFVPGHHYQATSEAWLRNLDAARDEVLARFSEDLDEVEARRAFGRWRLFFLAVAECFGVAGGNEWGVVHARLAPPAAAPVAE